MGKTDTTGSYSYICDGTSPGSPVLTDGHALYTPGLSENRGGVSAYYANDRLGNLWTLNGASRNQLAYEDYSGFGTWVSGATGGVVFGFGGGNGCQSDADTGLVLMGHRYYDTRIGRFISQDPIGDGTNWYAYCDNNPVNLTDPEGLFDSTNMNFTAIYNEADAEGGPGSEWTTTDSKGNVVYQFTVSTNNDWANVGGVSMHVPNGEDLGRNIAAARQFMASSASYSDYRPAKNGLGPALKRHDPKKIKAWLIAHVGNDNVWDYKHRSKDLGRYDQFGHVDYAAAASELRIDFTAIIAGQEVVHEQKYPGSALEPIDGEQLGYLYDQILYNPGPAEFGIIDMAP